MYKIYTEKGLLNITDFIGLIQALKFLVHTCQDIHNILEGIKKSNTVVIVDKFGNDWRIDYVETL
jgi:hypothetical protein